MDAKMIYAKDTTYELETKIKFIQEALNDELPWFDTVSDSDVVIYNKIYRNPDSEGNIIPEAYTTAGEYKQIFVDDRVAASIGFLPTGNRSVVDGYNTVTVDIICTVNLSKIYPGTTREDERALHDVLSTLREDNMITEINEVKEGVPNVFSGFFTDNIKFNNMQPWYCFSINADMEYNDSNC